MEQARSFRRVLVRLGSVRIALPPMCPNKQLIELLCPNQQICLPMLQGPNWEPLSVLQLHLTTMALWFGR
jgi:hypothetical protein